MSLKSEMIKNSWAEIDGFIDIDKAIEIAEKYAEEMCKRQRELCVLELSKETFGLLKHEYIELTNLVHNAPLATEDK